MAGQIRIAGGLGRAMAIDVLDEVIQPHETRRRLAEAFATVPPRAVACTATSPVTRPLLTIYPLT